jgi:molecular chaperone DnaK (HSP70)
VGIYEKGRVEIIPNGFGNKMTRSFVTLTDNGLQVEEEANNQAHLNPESSVYSIKRFNGRSFEDKEV